MLDLREFGAQCSILDKKTGIKHDLRIIIYETMLGALGILDSNHFPHYQEYVNEILPTVVGSIGPMHEITWYSFSSTEVSTEAFHAIEQCIKDGNKILVLEQLPEKYEY